MKRVFVGMEVRAPWGEEPSGRAIDEAGRHVTLAFLGDVEKVPGKEDWTKPPSEMGLVGSCSELLVLRNVVAYGIEWFSEDWLSGYAEGRYRAHVSVARKPVDEKGWKEAFRPLPVMGGPIHMYESVGKLRYEPIWTIDVAWPFEPLDHTGDVGFLVRGRDLNELYLHAQVALCFEHPPMLERVEKGDIASFEDMIERLNRMIWDEDREVGCPFKAVSYSGDYVDGQWEMIIDV